MTPPNTTPLNEELDRLHQKYLNREIDGNQYKQELTNLIQTLEKKARIDENVRSNSRLLSLQKGFMTLQEALDESFETLHQLKKGSE